VVVIVPLLVIVSGSVFVARRSWRPAAMLALTVGGAILLEAIVRGAVDRARPPAELWIGHYSGAAFPSGHAAQAVAFYGVLALIASSGRAPRQRALLWSAAAVLALVVGASRLYLGAHWLTDVLGGYALGGAWLILVMAIFLLAARDRASPAAS